MGKGPEVTLFQRRHFKKPVLHPRENGCEQNLDNKCWRRFGETTRFPVGGGAN